MKRIAFALLAALALSPAALADGLNSRGTVYAPTASVRPITCGFRVLAQGSFVNNDVNMGAISLDSLGSTAGGLGAQVGCAYTVNGMVIGVDADYVWDRSAFTATAGGVNVMKLPFGNQASTVAKLGYVMPNGSTMYGLYGYTWSQGQNGNMGGFALNFGGPMGATYGGGLIIPISQSIEFGMEARHVDFQTASNSVLGITNAVTENIVRASIGIRF